MEHRHLTFADILMLFTNKDLATEADLPDQNIHCDTCHSKIEKVDFIVAYLKKKNYKLAEKVYSGMQHNLRDLDSFYTLVVHSRIAEQNPHTFDKNPHSEKTSQIRNKRRVCYAVIGLTAVAFFLFANFFYYKLLPLREYISIPLEKTLSIAIERQGLFWGSLNISSDYILVHKDIITVSNGLILETNGIRLEALQQSVFGFTQRYATWLAQVKQGKFIIQFSDSFKTQRGVLLPNNCRLLANKAEVYVAVTAHISSFIVTEEGAMLHIPYQKQTPLYPQTLYSIKKIGSQLVLTEQKIDLSADKAAIEKLVFDKNSL